METTNGSKQDIKITTGGKDYIAPSVDLLSRTFAEDPVIRFILSGFTDEQRIAYLPTWMRSVMKAAYMNKGIFQEANDWSCCAIWLPPEKRVDNPFTMLQAGLLQATLRMGIGGIKRMLVDFQRQSDASKRRHLKDANGAPIKRYNYLFFIATDFHARGQGLASKVIARYQEKSGKENLPIWLEATTKKSRDIYHRQGFEILDEIRLGEGTHAESGAKQEGGPGVPQWSMMWRPNKQGDGSESYAVAGVA